MDGTSERRGPAEVVGIDERARDTAQIRRMIRRLDLMRMRPSSGTEARLRYLSRARAALELAAEAEQ